jgi:H+/Cl- antiporter ClcA
MKIRGDFATSGRVVSMSAIAALIGVACSFVAVLLLKMIDLFTNLFYFQQLSLTPRSPADHHLGIAAVVIPVAGGLILGLMARYGSEKIRGHGIPEALEAILFGKSIMQPKIAILKPLSSAISIGSGGPFGAEGPIIMTGGAVGSLLAQAFHLTAVERKTLLVAGAAAGMSAIFASPMAAVLLAVELLLFEWKPRSLIPVALASVIAGGIRPYLLGAGPLFPAPAHLPIEGLALAAAAAVGLAAGGFSALLSLSLYKIEDAFDHIPLHWMWWPAIGGLAVGIGGWFEPRALGVGYDLIADLLKGGLAPREIWGLLIVKCLIWIIALASGTSGGVLAPLLIMGCCLGSLLSAMLPGGASLWALVCMAAVLGGMMRCPFTAVIFAFELTHDVEALPPLLIASVAAYAFTVLVMKRSILTEKVARRGFDVFREYSVDPLEKVRIEDVMTKDPVTIAASLPVDEILALHFSGAQKHRGYPLLDDEGEILGVVCGSDILALRSAGSLHGINARDLLRRPFPITAHPRESCRTAAERMAETDVGRLLIVSSGSPRKLLGIITRSDLLKPRLKDMEEEQKHERFIGKRRLSRGGS